ncbi:MAG: hypothetical protein ABFQ89_04520 [Chloroflexota bacterium]
MARFSNWIKQHPQLSSWAVLSVGMMIILAWTGRDVGFTTSQWAALAVIAVGVAGICAWIIGWE